MASPVKQQQDVAVQFFSQDSFSGGINTATSGDKIADTEAVDILNFEYDSEDQLVSRSGVRKWHTNSPYTGRITSIHYLEDTSGNIHVLHTNADQLYRSDNTGSSPTNITGALTFPTDTFWMWRNFTGLAIGVNRATTGDNPVKVSGVTPTAAALGGSAPDANYIEIWNNRVWLSGASEPNTIYGSKLGDAEDWTASGAAGTVAIDISKNDGDRITGLIAFRERLFVFKRTKIYVVSATELPVTDPDNLRVDIFANNIGCISGYTVKSVLDDVLFLSESGVASLAASEAVGDFTSALISRNVNAIGKVSRLSDEYAAHVIEETDQFILGVPTELSKSGQPETFVLDYKNIQNRVVRWLRFNGKLVGTAYANIYVNGEKRILIGAIDTGNTYRIYEYIPKTTSIVQDDATNFVKKIITKAYNFQVPSFRKLFHRFFLAFQTLQENLTLNVDYFYDQLPTKTSTYTFNISADLTGSLWDVALWDTGLWDSGNEQFFRLWRQFKKNIYGRKGVNVTFIITCNNPEALILNNLSIEWSLLNERRVRNV